MYLRSVRCAPLPTPQSLIHDPGRGATFSLLTYLVITSQGHAREQCWCSPPGRIDRLFSTTGHFDSGFKTWRVVIRIVWIDLGRKVSRRDQSHNPFNSRCCLAAWRSERSDVLVFHLAKVVIPKRSDVLVLLCRCWLGRLRSRWVPVLIQEQNEHTYCKRLSFTAIRITLKILGSRTPCRHT